MKVIDLIKGMYEGELPSTVSFNMYGDRYTAYYNTRIMKLKIEDYNQNDICITNYYDEIEILDNDYLEEETKKEDLINHLVNECDCIIEDTPKVQVEMTQEEYNEYLDKKINTPKEEKKIEPINEYLDYLEDIPFSATLSKRFTHNELVIINKLNELIDKVNGE